MLSYERARSSLWPSVSERTFELFHRSVRNTVFGMWSRTKPRMELAVCDLSPTAQQRGPFGVGMSLQRPDRPVKEQSVRLRP